MSLVIGVGPDREVEAVDLDGLLERTRAATMSAGQASPPGVKARLRPLTRRAVLLECRAVLKP